MNECVEAYEIKEWVSINSTSGAEPAPKKTVKYLAVTVSITVVLCLLTVNYYQKTPLKYIRQGMEFREKKKWPEAAESFQKALSFNQNSPLLYTLLGEQYLSVNDFARSGFYFERALACGDRGGKARYCLGVISACRGDYKSISRIVQESTAHEKDRAYTSLLKLLASVMFPMHDELKAGMEAEDALRGLLDRSQDSLFLNLHLGLISIYQGQSDRAQEIFRKLLSARPGNSFFHTGLGIALMGCGKDEEAISELIKAKQMDAGDGVACGYLGKLYMDMNLDEKSLEELQRALEINPRSPGSLYFMGLWNMKKGKTQEAIGFFEKSLGWQPNHGNAHQKLSEACEKLKLNKRAKRESEEKKVMDGPLSISAPPL